MSAFKYFIMFGIIGILTLNSCSTQSFSQYNLETFANQINKDTIFKTLAVLASDEFEGRLTGEIGQKKSAEYLANQYKRLLIPYPKGADSYLQSVPAEFMKSSFGPKLKDSENVWAYIEGTEKKDEVLVISAHYDHLGIINGEINNGADDNASGTAAVLEIARMFKEAEKKGLKPKRSILFLHVTGEEYGLHGSRYYTENPIFELKNTIANLNIDMIGRITDDYISKGDYIYLVGSDRLSTDLHKISEEANDKYTKLILDYKYNKKSDPEKIYYRSDHYNFAKNGIPCIFYYNGSHADYHLPTDTAEKINKDLLAKRVKLIFVTAWELANTENRPVVDVVE